MPYFIIFFSAGLGGGRKAKHSDKRHNLEHAQIAEGGVPGEKGEAYSQDRGRKTGTPSLQRQVAVFALVVGKNVFHRGVVSWYFVPGTHYASVFFHSIDLC